MTTPPRLLAYCASHFGLGHERRTLAILSEVKQRVPELEMLLVAGNQLHLKSYRPPGLETMVLPSAKRFGKPNGLRAELLKATIAAYQPAVLYIEEEPAGHTGELMPALEMVQTIPNRPIVVTGIRDIVNNPASTRSYWRAHRHDFALEHYCDRVLIFGDRTLFDPILEYQWSAAVAAKTTICGYNNLLGPLKPAQEVRGQLGTGVQSLVVVTTGGGADGSNLLNTAMEALTQPEFAHVQTVLVSGPLASASLVRNLQLRAAGKPNISIESLVDDMPRLFNAADLVIAMGGHNTVSEITALQKRAILVPRKHPEQQMRADLFAARGLVHTFPWAELSPQRLATEIGKALAAPSPLNTLDFNGLTTAGDILAGYLTLQFTPFDP